MNCKLIVTASLLTLLLSAGTAVAEWTEVNQFPGDGNVCLSVAAVERNRAVAMCKNSYTGQDKLVMLTTSNGTTFSENQPPCQFCIMLDLDFPTPGRGYGVSALGAMMGSHHTYFSVNKGSSWNPLPDVPGKQQKGYQAVEFLDENLGWIGGVDGEVAYTGDGGQHWFVAITPNPATDLNDIHMLDALNGWACGGKSQENEQTGAISYLEQGFVWGTTDGGDTWQVLVEGKKEIFQRVFFVSRTTGWLIGDNLIRGFIRKTVDGGRTWTDQTVPQVNGKTVFSLMGLHMFNEQEGWAAGGAGTPEGGMGNTPALLHTIDGGQTWEAVLVPNAMGGSLYDLDFLNEHQGWAVGDVYKIWKFDDGTGQPDGDGTVDGDSVVDGDTVHPDGDREEEAPNDFAEPGQPCAYHCNFNLHGCDLDQGAPLCYWDDDGSFCSKQCWSDADCAIGELSGTCCQRIPGADRDFCTFRSGADPCPDSLSTDIEACPVSEPTAGPGQPCGPGGEGQLPKCGEGYKCGSDAQGTFCTKECTDDDECDGARCCDLETVTVCFYRSQLCPGEQPADGDIANDGDTIFDGDSLPDGDPGTDGDTTIDGDTTPDGDSQMDGDIIPDGDTGLDGDALVDGDFTIDGDGAVDGDTVPTDGDTQADGDQGGIRISGCESGNLSGGALLMIGLAVAVMLHRGKGRWVVED